MARMAAMERRGETAMRAMADIVVVTVRWSRSSAGKTVMEEQELDQSLDLSSSDTPGTLHSSSSFSHT